MIQALNLLPSSSPSCRVGRISGSPSWTSTQIQLLSGIYGNTSPSQHQDINFSFPSVSVLHVEVLRKHSMMFDSLLHTSLLSESVLTSSPVSGTSFPNFPSASSSPVNKKDSSSALCHLTHHTTLQQFSSKESRHNDIPKSLTPTTITFTHPTTNPSLNHTPIHNQTSFNLNITLIPPKSNYAIHPYITTGKYSIPNLTNKPKINSENMQCPVPSQNPPRRRASPGSWMFLLQPFQT